MISCNMKGLAGPWRLANAIRSAMKIRTAAKPATNYFDAVLLLPNSFRSALGARLSGAKIRVGYARDGRGWLLTHRANPAEHSKHAPIPAVDYYAKLAEFAFDVPPIEHQIELFVSEDENQAADELLRDVKPPFAILNPGANRADKRWPAEKFATLAETLAGSRGMTIVISGSPRERDLLKSIERTAKVKIINLAERNPELGTLKAVIKRAAVMVTNDTGPRHIAAALGTPVITLFGPTDHRWTTLCGVRERILLAEPFLPEELVADHHPKACAIEKISVQDVIAAVDALLR
jgi:heptosyltransferase-2